MIPITIKQLREYRHTKANILLLNAELDEKFCDVIVNRYIEQVGSSDGVSVERGGAVLKYEEVFISDE